MTAFFDSRRQMGVLAAATTGSVLSTTATVHSVFGTFLVPLSDEFGWTRASISAVMAIIAISCAITYPLAGRYSDQHGSRKMILFGNVALGLSSPSASSAPCPALRCSPSWLPSGSTATGARPWASARASATAWAR